MIRILLVDDHDIVRRGLRDLLGTREGWEICAEARDGVAAVEAAARHRPSVAIIDIGMTGLDGPVVTGQIRKVSPDTEVLIFTVHNSETLIRKVLAAGARGYLFKSDSDEHIIAAVKALSAHKPFFNPKVNQTIVEGFLRNGPGTDDRAGTLTPREREVLQLLARGRTNREVAATLHLSTKTVETHRAAIMRKLNIHSAVEMVRYALNNQLLDP